MSDKGKGRLPLLQLNEAETHEHFAQHGETGMSFVVATGTTAHTSGNQLFVLGSGGQVLLTSSAEYLAFGQLEDLTTVAWEWGRPGRERRGGVAIQETHLQVSKAFTSRTNLPTQALGQTALPAGFRPSAGARPLLGSVVLPADQVFYRYCWTPSDPAWDVALGNLHVRTYLTSELDHLLVNSGFGAVGRFSLPIPAPAVHVFQYLLPRGTRLRVGTVAPQFGQAGGGVEARVVKIPKSNPVLQMGQSVLPSF